MKSVIVVVKTCSIVDNSREFSFVLSMGSEVATLGPRMDSHGLMAGCCVEVSAGTGREHVQVRRSVYR
eukprot:6252324-Amphidinium_carterae.1